jgi:hypothetical protein
MALRFPNPSRSYDRTLRAVRFWGHDGALEAAFFVKEEALKRIEPGVLSEEMALLSAFDLHRREIYSAAARVYGRGRRGAYELMPSDF